MRWRFHCASRARRAQASSGGRRYGFVISALRFSGGGGEFVKRSEEQVRPLQLHLGRDATLYPVVDALRAASFVIAEKVGHLRRPSKALNPGCVISHAHIKHHV